MKARDKSGNKITPQSILNNGAEYWIDQIDGAYQGQLSWSYQKHGAGVFVSSNYDAYLGEWKNNHLNGRGCIIFRNGRIVITNFNRNKPYGLMITRDHERIVCGTIAEDQFKLVGIAFEYEFRTARWRMLQCKKNIHAMLWPQATSVMAEEDRDLSRGPPRIMTSEPKMFTFVKTFLLDFEHLFIFNKKQFLHREGMKDVFGGFKDGQPNGLAVIMKDNHIQQIGSFVYGKPHGFLYEEKGKGFSSGLYYHGLKNGFFEQSENHSEIITNEYIQGQFVGSINPGQQISVKKSQRKKYLERSKNFVSAMNDFTLQKLNHEFQAAPQPITDEEANERPKVLRQLIMPPPRSNSPNPFLKPPTSQRRAPRNTYSGSKFGSTFELSCLQTVRKKMPYFMKLMTEGDEGNDTISNEQNPFTPN